MPAAAISFGLRRIAVNLDVAVWSITSCLREQFESVENGLSFGFGDPFEELDHAIVPRPGQAVMDPEAGIGQAQLHHAPIVGPTLVPMDPASLLKLPHQATDGALRQSQPRREIRLVEPFGITQLSDRVGL